MLADTKDGCKGTPRRSRPMPVTRLNHAVLYVRDLDVTVSSTRVPRLPAVTLVARGRVPQPRARRTTTTSACSRSAGAPGRRRRSQHRRALPPRLGGRHPRRAAPPAPPCWPSAGRWSARRTTSPPSRSTPTTPTASSSRCAGCCRRPVLTHEIVDDARIPGPAARPRGGDRPVRCGPAAASGSRSPTGLRGDHHCHARWTPAELAHSGRTRIRRSCQGASPSAERRHCAGRSRLGDEMGQWQEASNRAGVAAVPSR